MDGALSRASDVMPILTLVDALRLARTPTVALVGAGGKTTALARLAHEMPSALVSTTTHLGLWQADFADRHVVWPPADTDMPRLDPGTGVTLVTGEIHAATGRVTGLPFDRIARLQAAAATRGVPLFIEADGARRLPLKAPARHEPAIPPEVDVVIVVAGLSGLGRPLDDRTVHRPEIFARLGRCAPGTPITADVLTRVLAHREGGLKNAPIRARRVLLLNQADSAELEVEAGHIAQALMPAYQAVIVARLHRSHEPDAAGDDRVRAVHEPAAGIVLAAGGSTRFGAPKQLLPYHGRPFVRAVAETALGAGLSPVIVVTGAHADEVRSAVEGLAVTCTHNKAWTSGQGSSVRTGVLALGADVGAAVFLLADQPQVTPAVIRALVAHHAARLVPVVAPSVNGRRANPMLFDRVTFPDLLALEGDVGGRAIVSRFAVETLPWSDAALFRDVDTPDDYRRLLADG